MRMRMRQKKLMHRFFNINKKAGLLNASKQVAAFTNASMRLPNAFNALNE